MYTMYVCVQVNISNSCDQGLGNDICNTYLYIHSTGDSKRKAYNESGYGYASADLLEMHLKSIFPCKISLKKNPIKIHLQIIV